MHSGCLTTNPGCLPNSPMPLTMSPGALTGGQVSLTASPGCLTANWPSLTMSPGPLTAGSGSLTVNSGRLTANPGFLTTSSGWVFFGVKGVIFSALYGFARKRVVILNGRRCSIEAARLCGYLNPDLFLYLLFGIAPKSNKKRQDKRMAPPFYSHSCYFILVLMNASICPANAPWQLEGQSFV